MSRDGVMLDIFFKSFLNLVRIEFNNEVKCVKNEVKFINSVYWSNMDRIWNVCNYLVFEFLL